MNLIKPNIPDLLTKDELNLIFGCLTNTWFQPTNSIATLPFIISEACKYKHLDEMYNVNAEKLVQKLEAMSFDYYFALTDAFERWRANFFGFTVPEGNVYSYFNTK